MLMVDVYTSSEVNTGFTNYVCSVSGVQNPTKTVGAPWKKIEWDAIEFDNFPLINPTVRCAVTYANSGKPSGNFVPTPGYYEFSAQIYAQPPQAGSGISVYLGLFDMGVNGTDEVLVAVANEEMPGGAHPSLSLTKVVKVPQTRYYCFQWYFLDGAGLTQTLNIQTAPIYCFASVKKIGKL
jgi:hypothetical protein